MREDGGGLLGQRKAIGYGNVLEVGGYK